LSDAKWLGDNCGLDNSDNEICVASENTNVFLSAAGNPACVGRTFDFAVFIDGDNSKDIIDSPSSSVFYEENVTTDWRTVWTDASTFGWLFGARDPVYRFYIESPGLNSVDSDNILKVCRGDSDCDGIQNGKDLCPNTPYGSIVNENGCTDEQQQCINQIDCTSVDWSDCDANNLRTRMICKNPNTGLAFFDSNGDCCDQQLTCRCNLGACLNHGNWIPSVRECLVEEDFPFFSAFNIFIVLSILISYYFFFKIKRRKK
jgi:hypothetical protein